MFGFEIRCNHKSPAYSEWAAVFPPRPPGGLERYAAQWSRVRDADAARGAATFGLWAEQVFGGLIADGGWWLWARAGNCPRSTFRLVSEFA